MPDSLYLRTVNSSHQDNILLALEDVEECAILSTDTVDEISDEFTETTLNLNGVEEGMTSYSLVVDLMLQYYDGILY